MFLHVIDAKYKGNYRIWMKFDDGSEGIVDLEDELDGPVFQPLKDPTFFCSFTLDPTAQTLVWPNGADFAPEYLKSKLEYPTDIYKEQSI